MKNGFTKGMMVGSILGASMGMIMNPEMNRNRRVMMRRSKNFIRRSGRVIGSMIDIMR